MRALSIEQISALEASDYRKLVLANGGPLWRPEDIEAYKAKIAEESRSRPYVGEAPAWHLSAVGRDYPYYVRDDGRTCGVPNFVAQRIDDIRDFFPEALFGVEFFGLDPILIVELERNGRTCTFFPLVWDEVNGKAVIVPPPQA